MDKRYRHILRYALAAVPLACVALLSSCAFDDDVAECPDPNAPATVRVSVSAGEPGDLNGTRAGDDVNADEKEFMHTLYLYIVDESGVVKKAFLNPLADYDLAKTGDLTNWDSEEFTLTPGDYTIYAFSNIDKYEGETNNASDNGYDFINTVFHEGYQTQNGGDVEEFRLLDPASKIDFAKGMYIPMSAKKTITITPNTRDISIGLDRLVSKVRITVPDNQYVSTNSTITFSGYSENVPLLGADSGYGSAELYGGRTATTDEMPFNQAGQEVSFYVNETNTGAPFTVTLSTGKSGNGDVSAYVAKTKRTDIPRNSIYPLSLTFPDFTPQFEWRSWDVAGATEPLEIVVNENNYRVRIGASRQFEFKATGITGNNAQLVSVKWNYDENTTSGVITNIQNNGNTFGGNISADESLVGREIPLTVIITWTGDYKNEQGETFNKEFTRTYNVIIEIISMWDDFEPVGSTRSGSWRAYRLTPEVLNMFIKR